MVNFIKHVQNTYSQRIFPAIQKNRATIGVLVAGTSISLLILGGIGACVVLTGKIEDSKEIQVCTNIFQKIEKDNFYTHEAKYTLNGRATVLITGEITENSNFEDLQVIAKQWRYQFVKNGILGFLDLNLAKVDTNISGVVLTNSIDHSLSKKDFSYVVCFDENQKIQAIATLKKGAQVGSNDYLTYLVTHPENLEKTSPKSISGSGSATVRHVCHDANTKRASLVELSSIPSAEKFYEKIGFIPCKLSDIAGDEKGNQGYISSKVLKPANHNFQETT